MMVLVVVVVRVWQNDFDFRDVTPSEEWLGKEAVPVHPRQKTWHWKRKFPLETIFLGVHLSYLGYWGVKIMISRPASLRENGAFKCLYLKLKHFCWLYFGRKCHNSLEKVVLQKIRKNHPGSSFFPTCPILVASCRYIWSAFGLGTIKALENEKNEVEQLRRRALSLGLLKQSKLSTDSKNDGLVAPLKAFETLSWLGPIVL